MFLLFQSALMVIHTQNGVPGIYPPLVAFCFREIPWDTHLPRYVKQKRCSFNGVPRKMIYKW